MKFLTSEIDSLNALKDSLEDRSFETSATASHSNTRQVTAALIASVFFVASAAAGRPLAGALVKLTNLKYDASPFEVHLTDHDGRASFTMPSSGPWLLNVIWTKTLPRSAETDFETVFSSLSLGFPSDHP